MNEQNTGVTINTIHAIRVPKPTWRWDMFGGDQVVIQLTDSVPDPSWLQRFMTKLLFGSVWKRIH